MLGDQMMKKTIGIFAHVDAGKTTFAEQLLYHTNCIRKRGRVDHKDAYLDGHDIERARGITIFADQAVISYKGSTYYLIDTPGHVDFSPEMERSVQVMDVAVLIISAVEGIQGHTQTVWELLRKHDVPTFFFINKTDRVGADVDGVIEQIGMHLTDQFLDMTGKIENSALDQDLIERIAELDEVLLEQYVKGVEDQMFWLRALRAKIAEGQLFPCASGSALQDIGIKHFFDQLHQLMEVHYDEGGSFGGRIYKIRHDDSGARLTFIKALSGTLQVRDELCYTHDGVQVCEKVNRLFIVNGNKFEDVDQVAAGDLFAVSGLSSAIVGQGIGNVSDQLVYEMVPTLKSKVLYEDAYHEKEVLEIFEILTAEEPSLNVSWDEHLQEIHVHIMGLVQLEVLEQLVQERFQLKVSFASPEILYKETIQSTVKGYGHFEPLRHYAEVHLLLEPGERNSGLTFENACHSHDLSIGHQNAIRTHLFEREHHGLLTGMPLTDIKITLLTGAAHKEHTSGGDFREATFRALRQGLEKAENVLLEPWYQFKIKVELDHLGRVMADIQKASGQFDAPQTTNTHAEIMGRVPVATFMNYRTELASFTHGRGFIQLTFGGYDLCHNAQEVIERKGYQKDADPLYTSSSIFCSKGHGYAVPWDEAEAKMHLL